MALICHAIEGKATQNLELVLRNALENRATPERFDRFEHAAVHDLRGLPVRDDKHRSSGDDRASTALRQVQSVVAVHSSSRRKAQT